MLVFTWGGIRRNRVQTYACIIAALTLVDVRQVSAQNSQVVKATVSLDVTSRKNFDDVFAAISDQAHVTIVAEGVPLHPLLSDQQLTALTSSLPAGRPVGTKDAVSAAAAAFDYKAEPVGANMFLLHKQYTDPADLPCVTYDEIVYSLRNLLKVTDLYDPKTPTSGPGTAAEQLAKALSPQQLAKPYLVMGDLDPEQRQLAVMASEQIGIQNKSTGLQSLLAHLLLLKKPVSVFQWMTIDSDKVFGYSIRSTRRQDSARYPITDGYKIQASGAVKERSARITWSHNVRPDLDVLPNPKNSAAVRSVPSEEDRRLAPGMLANRLPSTRTLAEAIAAAFPIRQADGAASKDSPRPTADSAIAEKPVSIFGPSRCSKEQLLKSLCTVYGLEVRADKSGTPTLTMRRARPVSTMADLPKEARRLVPEPLLHALDGQAAAFLTTEPKNKKAEARQAADDLEIFRNYSAMSCGVMICC